MHSWMRRYNSNARNRASKRTLTGSNLTPANMSSNDRTTSVRSLGTVCPIIQESQQTRQESATVHPVTIGVGIGLTANGTLADSESSASDSTRLMIDLNVPYHSESEIERAVGFDVNEMIRNQQHRCRRKRKAPDSTSVNPRGSSSSSNYTRSHHVPGQSNQITPSMVTTGGISMSGTSHTVSDFVSSVRNTGLIPSESVPENQRSIDMHGISAGNAQLYSLIQSYRIASQSYSSSYRRMELLNRTSARLQRFIQRYGSSRLQVLFQRHGSSRLQSLSPANWMTNSNFVETPSISHIPRANNARSSQSNAFVQPLISPMMLRDLLESALRHQSDAVVHPSSGPVRYLGENGVGDTRRAATILRGRSMINAIDPPPLPLEIGETVAADNRERLLPMAGGVREPGHRDDPIVIEDDEEEEHGDAQQGVIRVFVGNLSYEQLLALQERMGAVDTGLKKKVISELLKQRKYQSTEMNDDTESCCVCLDTYSDGEELGKIDCGHEFHYHCIRKWLKIKNFCPICKRTALTP